MRGGLAQLLEYGNPDDLLCVVVDREIPLRRARLLDAFEVVVLVVSTDGWRSIRVGIRTPRVEAGQDAEQPVLPPTRRENPPTSRGYRGHRTRTLR